MTASHSGITRRTIISASILSALTPVALAQPYPSRPIRIIVPYAAGGTTDQIARLVAPFMSKTLGQSIVIENKAGANSMIGGRLVAAAEPDGYTILFATDANMVLNPLLYKNPGFDPERDFAPVGLLVDVPQILAVSPKLPVRSVTELVQYAKKHPNELNYSSSGRGGNSDLAGEMFMQEFGITMTGVPFNGGGPALNAALAGTVQVLFGTLGSALQHLKAGTLVPLAVTTAQRVSILPDVPTIAESGSPSFEAPLRYGLIVPAKTPAVIIQRLNDAVNKTLVIPELRSQLENSGYVVYQPHAPAAYAKANVQSREQWGKLIRAKNISLD